MMTTSLNVANSLINQGPSVCCSLGWIVSYSRYLNRYIMEALCISKTCLKSRNHLTPCEIPLNLYNRNETWQHLALDHLPILEVSCGMTSPSILKIRQINSSWPSATYMRRDFQCLFPQRPRYGALISVLISPVPHTWGVTNGSLLASPPNSRRSPASLISPAPHICGASRTPILTLSCGKY